MRSERAGVNGVFRVGRFRNNCWRFREFRASVHWCTRQGLQVLDQAFNEPGNSGSKKGVDACTWDFSSPRCKLAVQRAEDAAGRHAIEEQGKSNSRWRRMKESYWVAETAALERRSHQA